MSKEYIEREPLQKLFNEVSTSLLCKKELVKDTEHMVRAFLMVTEMIQDAPAADVAPVVRCKECKHWKPSGSKAGNSFSDMEYIGGCEFTKYCRRESDFCSYGERKEGAD